jgi:hypothetical protein
MAISYPEFHLVLIGGITALLTNNSYCPNSLLLFMADSRAKRPIGVALRQTPRQDKMPPNRTPVAQKIV